MTNEQTAALTRRITESNPSGIINILYEIFFIRTAEAKQAIAENDDAAMRTALRYAGLVLIHLKNALNFKYELSYQLFPLYDFCQRALEKANYSKSITAVEEAERIMKPLSEAFSEVAKADTSAPVMKHTEKMVAGMTYGRNDLNETAENFDSNRGFLA